MNKPSLTKHHTKSTEAQTLFQPFYIAQMTDNVIKMEAGSVAGYIHQNYGILSTSLHGLLDGQSARNKYGGSYLLLFSTSD